MSSNYAPQELPKKRTGKSLDWLDCKKVWEIVLWGLAAYFIIVIFFSLIEWLFCFDGIYLILDNYNAPVSNILDILYFNLITILTVGYGDFHPVLFGKLLSVIEAFTGVALFSILVALVTVKVLLPPTNTIVFSKYAYYCTEPECFLIIFVNTSQTNLVNAEISSYFKLGLDWVVQPAITSPFITQAVQTFYLNKVYLQDIFSQLNEKDCLRIGISGNLGLTRFSTSIQYSLDEIFVIENRDELTAYEGFWNPDFNSSYFQEMFHYHPKGVATLTSYVDSVKRLEK